MGDKQKLVARWRASLTRGTGHDSWGQLVEAVDEYQMLSKQVLREASHEATLFNDNQKRTLSKIAACLDLRGKALQSPDSTQGFTLEELKKVDSAFGSLLTSSQSEFPVAMPAEAALFRPQVKQGNFELDLEGDEIDDEDDDEAGTNKGSVTASPGIKPLGKLFPMMPHQKGTTNLVVRIEKIGLKDASMYLDPYIVISLKDNKGIDVAKPQETPVALRREDPYIIYGVDVHLQKPLEKLPKGAAIFFEFRHYKLKKRTISTKCFAFMEMDEIKPGPLVIELYQKPTDFRRKKLSLLTTKPLYLHLYLNLIAD
ncbi:axin interactor, dorsalization-associated protein A-like [Patiria miniata]|uniref:C2 Aida-type domain-containing protein n=1 Tax=Patiria miniata TaxID=46514 RepID=A0A914BB75_PATMI|nr:axin interactor, dorsalization-associated protein A-like [Patiria miniata]XP_038073275.1 axin interactor, dorsalization-associated protein A-like [Patiria miniata]